MKGSRYRVRSGIEKGKLSRDIHVKIQRDRLTWVR